MTDDTTNDALLAALATAPLDTADLAAAWLAHSGIAPGTTRVPAIKLYYEYQDWCKSTYGYVPIGKAHHMLWGRIVKQRLRQVRGNACKYYLVRRG